MREDIFNFIDDIEIYQNTSTYINLQTSKELKEFGVPVLHYYTLGKPKVIWNVVKELV